ncbi:helix-turn-helix transcriptional regulator [Kriegella aquimaris]|uniref:Predicted DNA-binding transcriptional regulator YafY, contains an HTH and WYL domains n=1 Tax=Kriegella aquimaris TaxID=192904 RepID=A0A1G9SK75_9FLAO|nr:WYL domain-containing protein [Kriegella aquimaris]SDM35819.1 Predicted DNA-binding transcriptional regulator YafY, contains an HTH and WYL domains [Kriegella aquimaris]
MAITKNVLIRYHALDRCFSNPGKNYDLSALLEECNTDLYEYNPNSDGIQRRQLYDDIKFMESSQGWSIDLEKTKIGRNVYYRYADPKFSIKKEPINELEAEQIKSAMLVLTRFKGLPQFEWINELLPKLDQTFKLSNQSQEIMSFESNEFLEGLEYISPLFNAMLYKQCLSITYRSFKSDEDTMLTFFPYHLKQYNNRWFLFGKGGDYDNLTNLALDRIIQIKNSNLPFIENTEIDFNEYFEDIIGVSKSIGVKESKIILHAVPDLAPYIKTKPLHGSQQKITDNDQGFTFSIKVIPNYELEKLVLSFGEQLKLLEPEELRIKLKARLQNSLNNFN